MNLLSFAMLLSTSLFPAGRQVQWPLWNSYAGHFIQNDGRVVDPSRDNMTTSEGQSYAMFFALVANDRERYDRLYRWTADNLAQGDLTAVLPAWSWGRKADGSFGTLDANSSSDADLWLAYDLLEGGRLWKQAAYIKTGMALLARIEREEVVAVNGQPVLLPGKTGFVHGSTSWMNPSYEPLFLLEKASRVSSDGPWKALAAALPLLLHQASLGGFAPDWISLAAEGKAHAAAPANSEATVPVGGYDAIRVYLWAGITASDAQHREAVLRELYGMTDAMRVRTTPPELVSGPGALLEGDGPIGFSAALIPFLNAVQQPAAAQIQAKRLRAGWLPATGLYGNPPRYYDQNLAMFSLGYTEHRYRILPDGDLDVPWTKKER